MKINDNMTFSSFIASISILLAGFTTKSWMHWKWNVSTNLKRDLCILNNDNVDVNQRYLFACNRFFNVIGWMNQMEILPLIELN